MTEGAKNSRARASGDDLHRWLITVWMVIVRVFGAGGAWALLARISGAIVAPGQVSPESGVRTVQHPDGGVVTDIRVREGDAVRKGQVLVVLQDEILHADLEIVRNKLNNVLVDIARLKAERDNAEELQFPKGLVKKARRDPQIREMIHMQRDLFLSRRQAFTGQQRLYQQNIAAHEKAIAGLRARLEAIREQSALVREEIDTVSGLVKKGQAIRPRLLALQREAARLEGEHGSLLEEIARRKEEIARFSQQLEQLKRTFLAQVMEDLVKREEEAANLKEKLLALEQKLARVKIRAPISGHVFNMAIRTIGGVIKPGDPVLQIVPDKEPLIVEAQVRPIDIDNVHPGQTAWLYFTAIGTRNTPKVKGRVRVVSPAPVANGRKQAPYYRVEIGVPLAQLQRLGEKRRIVPGMPVEAFLTTRARRPFDILFVDTLLPHARRVLRSD